MIQQEPFSCFRPRTGFLDRPGALAQGRVRTHSWRSPVGPRTCSRPGSPSVSWPQNGVGRLTQQPCRPCSTPLRVWRVSNENVLDKWVLYKTYYPQIKWKLKWAKGVSPFLINISTRNENLQKQQETEDPWCRHKVLRGRICHRFRDH